MYVSTVSNVTVAGCTFYNHSLSGDLSSGAAVYMVNTFHPDLLATFARLLLI